MKRYIPILIMAISIAVTSCNNLLVKESATQEEKACVSLAVGSSSSRTILPESYDAVASLVNFTFTATSTAGEDVTHSFTDYDSLQEAQLFFTSGTYDCKLSATSTGGIKYEGVLEDKVIEPGDNLLAFKLQVVQLSTEPSTLEVQLTFPGTNVAVVKAGLYSIAGEALDGFPEEVLEITSGNTVTYNKDKVPGGNHLVQFSFYGDADCTVLLGTHTEVVVIVSGKKSAATRSIESINPMYTITYELNEGTFIEGYTVLGKFTPGMELQLPKTSEVRKSGMSFFGWYTDAAFTGSPVYFIPQGTCENKVYYAKWGTFTAETIDVIDLRSVAGDCDLVISGPITSDTISTLKSKLTAAGESAKIHLDLSQTTGLTSIVKDAFRGCSELTSVEIPSSVTRIGDYAFGYCSGLTSVEIPLSVTSIGVSTFSNCSGLTSVTFGEGSQLESIGSYAFGSCSGLTSVEIPSSVTSIGDSAFKWCSGLTSVTFGEGSQLESIGSYAFMDCSGLTSVEIPSSVTSIGDAAFRECRGLTSVEIPSSVTSIGDSAFKWCSGLTSVTFGEGSQLESIGSYAFDGCSGLTSVEIPSSVTSIGDNAFIDCSGLTSVEIPSSVTSIGVTAFRYCRGLTSVTFGDINGWYVTTNSSDWYGKTGGRGVTLSATDLYVNATLVRDTYVGYYWYKVD